MNPKSVLIITAHGQDLILQAGGAIARYTQEGCQVYAIAIDSANSCQQQIRQAAHLLGVHSLEFWPREEQPAALSREQVEQLATAMRRIRPDFILTHDKEPDALYPEHTLVSDAVRMAYTIASGAGAWCEGQPVSPRQTPMFGLEPSAPEQAGFRPSLYVDISACMQKKLEAISMLPQGKAYGAAQQRRAEAHGEACRSYGGADFEYAEAFAGWGPVCQHDSFVCPEEKQGLLVAQRCSDLVLRCGGTILRYAEAGPSLSAVILGTGQDTPENRTALESLGLRDVEFWPVEELPMELGMDMAERLARYVEQRHPGFIITHALERDPTDPDACRIAQLTLRAQAVVAARCGSPRRAPVYGMEPRESEHSGWVPGVMLDITRELEGWEKAARLLNLPQGEEAYWQEKGSIRGVHCAGRGGKSGCKAAEAYSAFYPIYAHGKFVW